MRRIVAVVLSVLLLLSCFAGCSKKVDEKISAQDAEEVSFKLDELPTLDEFNPNGGLEYFYEDGPLDEFKASDKYGRMDD